MRSLARCKYLYKQKKRCVFECRYMKRLWVSLSSTGIKLSKNIRNLKNGRKLILIRKLSRQLTIRVRKQKRKKGNQKEHTGKKRKSVINKKYQNWMNWQTNRVELLKRRNARFTTTHVLSNLDGCGCSTNRITTIQSIDTTMDRLEIRMSKSIRYVLQIVRWKGTIRSNC